MSKLWFALKLMLGLLLILLIADILFYAWAWNFIKAELKEVAEIRKPAAGHVQLSQVPLYLQQATIASEDPDFYTYSHRLDLWLLPKIARVLILEQPLEESRLGVSVVKMLPYKQPRPLNRNVKLFLLGFALESQYTKAEILELYLNTMPYGVTEVGVKAAAQSYFGKEVKELTLVESALIAGLPQRPSSYSPHRGETDENGEPLWQMRTRHILERMKDNAYIDETQYNQALVEMQTLELVGNQGN